LTKLLSVERRAVDIARLAIGFPRKSQDGRLIDEAVGNRHGLGGRGHEFPPFFKWEVRHYDCRPLAMPRTNEAEHLVGVLAIEIRKPRVIKEQQIGRGDAAKGLPVRTVRQTCGSVTPV
jgi:hypothetical protein